MGQNAKLSAPSGASWYAVHTRSRHEKLVALQLAQRDVENFLPVRLEVHRWKDRYKKVEMPMFSGYLFVHLDPEAERGPALRLGVLRTPGVVRIVGFGNADARVPGEQIDSLRRIVEQRVSSERHRFLRAGQKIKILSGALAGVTGILSQVKGSQRLVVSLKSIRQGVSIELAGYEVAPID